MKDRVAREQDEKKNKAPNWDTAHVLRAIYMRLITRENDEGRRITMFDAMDFIDARPELFAALDKLMNDKDCVPMGPGSLPPLDLPYIELCDQYEKCEKCKRDEEDQPER